MSKYTEEQLSVLMEYYNSRALGKPLNTIGKLCIVGVIIRNNEIVATAIDPEKITIVYRSIINIAEELSLLLPDEVLKIFFSSL
jgi:hypothetical protein